jgi:hypothetical protein
MEKATGAARRTRHLSVFRRGAFFILNINISTGVVTLHPFAVKKYFPHPRKALILQAFSFSPFCPRPIDLYNVTALTIFTGALIEARQAV